MKLMKLNEFFKDQLERERITSASDWKHNCNFFFPNHAFYYSSKFMILKIVACFIVTLFLTIKKEDLKENVLHIYLKYINSYKYV